MTEKINIHWFQNDLRIQNNQALIDAAQQNKLILIYIVDSSVLEHRKRGSASNWYLHHALDLLQTELKTLKQKIYFFKDNPIHVFQQLKKQFEIEKITCNSVGHHALSHAEDLISSFCKNHDITFKKYYDNFLIPPQSLQKEDGSPYKIYTAFWNAFQKNELNFNLSCKINKLPPPATSKIAAKSLEELQLLDSHPWHKKLHQYHQLQTSLIEKKMHSFLTKQLDTYLIQRDLPAQQGTSQLGAALHFGQISPQTIWSQIKSQQINLHAFNNKSHEQFCKELVWREFAYHQLANNIDMPDTPLVKSFIKFPAMQNDRYLRAWQTGQTGYPIIDAGMRQLWETGWMHNRVRMIVASFLVKHLLLPWQEGAKWFWDTLTDADLANNSQGWQWSAGCGVDAAPFFRIFNPTLQSKKFDPQGEYIRAWVPELQNLPNKFIHEPWMAPPIELSAANVTLGKTYPKPIVEHKSAREKALAAFSSLKKI